MTNLKIENINNLVLDEGYATINVGTLNNKLVLDAGYGSFIADRFRQALNRSR